MAIDSTELLIRPFVEDDEAEVTSWFANAGELRFFVGKRLTWPVDAGQWRSIRLDPSVTAWTGVRADSPIPIAHAELIEESPAILRLASVAVAPHERGRGVGLGLVASLIEKGRASGHTLLTVMVHQDYSTAIRGYGGLGFTLVDEAPEFGQLRMELALD